jgi:hypothetical protein
MARRYLKSTAADEPQRLAVGETSESAERGLNEVCQTVRAVEAKTEKDALIYNELLQGLRRVLAMRDQRLNVSATRIPTTLWNVVLFASVVLLGGFVVLGLRSVALSLGVVAAVTGTVVFLISVIKDIDNPFRGVWNVTYAPLKTAAARIERM